MYMVAVSAHANGIALHRFAYAADVLPQFVAYFVVDKWVAVFSTECDVYINIGERLGHDNYACALTGLGLEFVRFPQGDALCYCLRAFSPFAP